MPQFSLHCQVATGQLYKILNEYKKYILRDALLVLLSLLYIIPILLNMYRRQLRIILDFAIVQLFIHCLQLRWIRIQLYLYRKRLLWTVSMWLENCSHLYSYRDLCIRYWLIS